MNVPAEFYVGSNSLQRQEANYVIEKYSNKIQWRNDGNESILDIGSGSGDITNDIILPILPKEHKKFIGVDVAEGMVKLANMRYSDSKRSFEVWDMRGSSASLLHRHPEGFDHIFSFNAIHWSPEPKHVFQNIYDLLTINGDCLLLFLGEMEYLDVDDAVWSMPKWSKIIKNPTSMPMPYRFKKDRVGIVQNQLKSIGFKGISIDTYVSSFTFNNLAILKRHISAVNSNLLALTPAEKDEYFCDYVNVACDMGSAEWTNYPDDAQYKNTYKYIVVYAQK